MIMMASGIDHMHSMQYILGARRPRLALSCRAPQGNPLRIFFFLVSAAATRTKRSKCILGARKRGPGATRPESLTCRRFLVGETLFREKIACSGSICCIKAASGGAYSEGPSSEVFKDSNVAVTQLLL